MTVGELGARMSSAEYVHWAEYFRLEQEELDAARATPAAGADDGED